MKTGASMTISCAGPGGRGMAGNAPGGGMPNPGGGMGGMPGGGMPGMPGIGKGGGTPKPLPMPLPLPAFSTISLWSSESCSAHTSTALATLSCSLLSYQTTMWSLGSSSTWPYDRMLLPVSCTLRSPDASLTSSMHLPRVPSRSPTMSVPYTHCRPLMHLSDSEKRASITPRSSAISCPPHGTEAAGAPWSLCLASMAWSWRLKTTYAMPLETFCRRSRRISLTSVAPSR
mmetsp:Transcript_10730/g.29161  ORF Transcript_10730/g.29161 Transcript_10730/m.29161 type:complete len:230 (-) Transcript_10730:1346-2035(-)